MLGDIRQVAGLLYNYRRPLDELEALRDRRLRTLVQHAYDKVPYYRDLFQSAGLTPQDIQTVRDLHRIPISTKQMLRSWPIEKRTAAGTNPKACIIRSTSGTTGEPFTVYFSPREVRAVQLVDLRALLTVGLRPWDRVVILGPQPKTGTRWYEKVGLFRTDMIWSAFDQATQIQRLRELQPTVLWAYAHVLDALVDELHGHLSSAVRPRILITSAYNLPDRAYQALRADLGAEIFNFYGAMEAGRIAHECPAHRGLHVNCDRLILECVQDDSSRINGGMGSAIVTPLDLFTMPFIRYRLGDLVAFSDQSCVCGSSFPLIHAPQGREYDLLVLPSGRQVSVTWLAVILRGVAGVERFRVTQERPEHITVELSFETAPAPGSLDDLTRQIAQRFPEPLQIEIQLTDFAAEQGHKLKSIVSHVKHAESDR